MSLASKFSNLWNEIGVVAQRTGRSKLYHIADAVGAFIAHGMNVREYVVGKGYLLNGYQRRNMVTLRRWEKNIHPSFNDPRCEKILLDKGEFDSYFKKFIRRDWIDTRKESPEDIRAFIEKHGRVIVKPFDEMQGKGIHIISHYSDKYASGEYMMEQLIRQNRKMVLNNKSINTIRVYTILDGEGNPHIIKALLRAGVGDAIVDNAHAGGMVYPLNLEKGIVEGYGKDSGYYKEYLYHPGSDIVMLGFQVPYWDKVKETVMEAAKMLPQVRNIGWDVAILEDGVELVEGNHNAGLEYLEFVGSRGHYKEIMAYK